MKNFNVVLLATLVLFTFYSCEKQEKLNSPSTDHHSLQSEISPEIIDGIAKMGFDVENYPVAKTNEGYIVEGDMVLDVTEKEILSPNFQKQRRSGRVSCSIAKRIRVKSSLGNNTRFLISAIDRWNRVSSKVNFVLVTKNEDIRVFYSTNPKVADAKLPSKGKPGFRIRVNKKFFSSKRFLKNNNSRVDVLAHELGHTIGLHHTNSSSGSFISGTSRVDSRSIMDSKIEGDGANFITSNDKKAVRIMYSPCK